MSNPYVFIVGCPRSGTTLLQRMVNAHSQIAITSESRWIPEWFEERRGLTSDGLVTSELVDQLLAHPRFAPWRIGRVKLLALMENGQLMSYSSFVTSIFELHGKAKGKALVGNKTPAHVRMMDTLHYLWPNARFVHLVRDGRAVYLSVAQWPKAYQEDKPGSFATWKEDPVSTTAFWWELNVRLGRKAGNMLGLNNLYYEIRYESLVSQPAKECEALCGFLGLMYEDAMLRFHEGRTIDDPRLSAKRGRRPITPGLRDWRSQMPAEDVERFEAAAGPLLEELGYERACPCVRPEKVEAASRIRDLLAQDPNWLKVCTPGRGVITQEGAEGADNSARNLPA